MKLISNYTAIPVALFSLFAGAVSAQTYTGIQDSIPVAVELGGNAKYDGWYNLTINSKTKTVHGTSHTFAGHTGYPTAMASSPAWVSPIYSQIKSGSQVALNKVANGNGSGGLNKFNADGTRNATAWGGSGFGPYPASDSIYAIAFSNVYNARGGTLAVFETNPVADLKTVTLQLQIGSANGYDFWEPGVASNDATPFGSVASRQLGLLSDFETWAPVINLTFGDTSTATIVADYAALLNQGYNGTIDMQTGPGGTMQPEDIWINLYGFQWDLSSYSDIVSYNVAWTVVEHTQSYAVQLDQSDVFGGEVLSSAVAVPEPSSYAALCGGLALAGVLLRRRRAASRVTA